MVSNRNSQSVLNERNDLMWKRLAVPSYVDRFVLVVSWLDDSRDEQLQSVVGVNSGVQSCLFCS